MNSVSAPSGERKPSALTWDALSHILRRPVAFYPIFAKIGGSAKAGLFLSQAFYWSNTMEAHHRSKGTEWDGWFYKTQVEWEEETCLNDEEQLTARRALVKRGLLEDARRGQPARLHFRLNRDAILAAIEMVLSLEPDSGKVGIQIPGKSESSSQESRNLVPGMSGSKNGAKSESLYKDSETTSDIDDAASADAVAGRLIALGIAPDVAERHARENLAACRHALAYIEQNPKWRQGRVNIAGALIRIIENPARYQLKTVAQLDPAVTAFLDALPESRREQARTLAESGDAGLLAFAAEWDAMSEEEQKARLSRLEAPHVPLAVLMEPWP